MLSLKLIEQAERILSDYKVTDDLQLILTSEQLTDLAIDSGDTDFHVKPDKLWYVDKNGYKEVDNA